MAAFLVTGNPGSGKTAMAAELSRLGHLAVDTDDTIAGWETESGLPVQQPKDPGDAWLLSHRWVWSRQRLEQAIGTYDLRREHVFFCGIAMNQRELIDHFEVVFLLALDDETQVARLDTPSNAHRNAALRAQILDGRPVFEREMRAAGAVVLDGRRPTAALARRILMIASSGSRV